MVEEIILGAIAEKIDPDILNLQIVIQERILYLYINRDREADLDYTQVASIIQNTVSELEDLDFSSIELYSRILGETEPDWHSSIELIAKDVESIATEETNEVESGQSLIIDAEKEIEIASNNEIAETQEQTEDVASNTLPDPDIQFSEVAEEIATPEAEILDDFSQYSFIRNKRLLTADIVSPSANIARLIATFDGFSDSIKRSQLPVLEAYFNRNQQPEIEDLELEIKSWWTDILNFDDDPKRKFAIWMSRYCCDYESTITKIESVLSYQEEVKKAKETEIREKAKQKRKAANQAYLESRTSSQGLNSNSNTSKSRSKSKKQSSKTVLIEAVVSSLFIIFVARPLYRAFFNNFFNSYAANEIIEINQDVLANYTQTELDEAKKLADLGIREDRKDSLVQAIEYTKRSLKIFPGYARAYFNLGTFREKYGYYENALEDYTKAIEAYPDSLSPANILHSAYNNRGLVFQELGEYEAALEDADEAVALAPEDGGYYANRGLAYLKLQDYESAIADQTRAIELEPKNPGWYYNRGNVYQKTLEYNKALEDYDKAISLNRAFGRAYEQRYYVYLKLNRIGRAAQDYDRAKFFGSKPSHKINGKK